MTKTYYSDECQEQEGKAPENDVLNSKNATIHTYTINGYKHTHL